MDKLMIKLNIIAVSRHDLLNLHLRFLNLKCPIISNVNVQLHEFAGGNGYYWIPTPSPLSSVSDYLNSINL